MNTERTESNDKNEKNDAKNTTKNNLQIKSASINLQIIQS